MNDALEDVRSLGFRTDMALVRFDGSVEAREDCWVIRTPSSPEFYWGNLIVFRKAPRNEADAEAFLATFERELGEAGLSHTLLAWDTPGQQGEVAPFVARGFEADEGVTLTTRTLRPPPHPNAAVEIRRLESDAEWEEATEVQAASFNTKKEESDFARDQMPRYRRMVEAGLGDFWGGYLDGRLVGALGLYFIGDVGRYQLVGTHPDFRGRGVAGTLVHGVGERALTSGRATTLVMTADANYHAARIYQSVGFEPTERLYAVMKLPEGG